MGREPVELLADIGLGRQQQRLLVEAVRDRAPGAASMSWRICAASLSRIAAGWRAGLASASCASASISSMRASRTRASASPSPTRIAAHAVERRVETGEEVAMKRRALGLALLRLVGLEHALDREQAIEAGRSGVDALADLGHRGDDRIENGLVDAHGRRRRLALDGEADLAGAAGERSRRWRRGPDPRARRSPAAAAGGCRGPCR